MPNTQRDEAKEHAAFEQLLGGADRAFRLLRLYSNSYPSGTEYDRLMGRGHTKEQVFAIKAKNNGFTPKEIRAFNNLQS